jgi:hypothetical protein
VKRIAVALALAAPGCTGVFPALTATTIAIHNSAEPSDDHWDYGKPCGSAALVGLGVDIAVIVWFFKNIPGVR